MASYLQSHINLSREWNVQDLPVSTPLQNLYKARHDVFRSKVHWDTPAPQILHPILAGFRQLLEQWTSQLGEQLYVGHSNICVHIDTCVDDIHAAIHMCREFQVGHPSLQQWPGRSSFSYIQV